MSNGLELKDVVLTDREKDIFSLLLNVNRNAKLGQTIRVAGGWVRDKLLGLECDDIDITLDSMTGEAFCKHIAAQNGKKFGVIDANPEQSKHLATATMNLFGLDVDFVNLRSETYTDSRIPVVEFGTVKQDAERRDFTINALYYNLATGQVEDYVDGLSDLKYVFLRTPLPPKQTFIDDPLRVMRGLRFHSTFVNSHFPPYSDKNMRADYAMALPEVHDAFVNKVSRERVQVELMKLLSGGAPIRAIELMYEKGILNLLLEDPERDHILCPFDLDQMTHWHRHNVFEHTISMMNWFSLFLDKLEVTGHKRALLLLAALFHDLGKLDSRCWGYKYIDSSEIVPDELLNEAMMKKHVRRTYHDHAEYSAQHARGIMKHLRFGADDIEFVAKMCAEHMGPHNLEWSDKAIRKMLNRWGDDWQLLWYHALADTYGSGRPQGDTRVDIAAKHKIMHRAEELLKTDITPPTIQKPVLNGNIIMEMIPELQPKSGFIKELQEIFKEKRFEDPAFGENEAKQYIVDNKGDILTKYGATQ